MRLRVGLPILIALMALLSAWLVTQDIGGGPLRAGLVLAFLLFGPGAAYVLLLRLPSLAYTLILSVAFSLTLDLLVAAVAVYGGFWSPPLIMNILVGITFAGLLGHAILDSRRDDRGDDQTNNHETRRTIPPPDHADEPLPQWSQGAPHIESGTRE